MSECHFALKLRKMTPRQERQDMNYIPWGQFKQHDNVTKVIEVRGRPDLS